jgi:excinuclease UvrABC nuclease subunit
MHLRFEISPPPSGSSGPPDCSAAPDAPGVVLLEPEGGRAYLARTQNIRKRLIRLLHADVGRGRIFGEAVRRIAYQPTASPFEASWLLYLAAKDVWADDYRQRLRLKPPACVKLHMANAFPRTSVTTQIAGGDALYFGPFRSRSQAEAFDGRLLDFFGVRRCVENLEPSPGHPGCIYGEMGKCLRPCQEAVTSEDYRAEAARLAEALSTRGHSLAVALEAERDEASDALEFEDAQRLHAKLEALKETMRLAEEPARELDQLHAAVIQKSVEPDAVSIWPVYAGFLQEPFDFPLQTDAERPQSLDRRVREAWQQREPKRGGPREREDHLALLRRWLYSSWRKGELVAFEDPERVPYRKLVNAVARTATGAGERRELTAAMRAQAQTKKEQEG